MVGVEDEDAVEGPGQHRIDPVLLAGRGEHHVDEVLGIAQIVARIDEGLTDRVLVGPGGDGRHLGDHPVGGDHPVMRILDVQVLVVEGAERTHHGDHQGHGMGVAAEAPEQELHLLVEHGVVGDVVDELEPLGAVRQLAEQDQIGGLQEVALLRQLLDAVAAVEEDAGVTVDVGDRGTAARRRGEPRIVGEHAGLAVEPPHVDHPWAEGAVVNGELRLDAAGTAQSHAVRLAHRCLLSMDGADAGRGRLHRVRATLAALQHPINDLAALRDCGPGPHPRCGPGPPRVPARTSPRTAPATRRYR